MELIYLVGLGCLVAGGLLVFLFNRMKSNDPASAARLETDASFAVAQLKEEMRGLRAFIESKLK